MFASELESGQTPFVIEPSDLLLPLRRSADRLGLLRCLFYALHFRSVTLTHVHAKVLIAARNHTNDCTYRLHIFPSYSTTVEYSSMKLRSSPISKLRSQNENCSRKALRLCSSVWTTGTSLSAACSAPHRYSPHILRVVRRRLVPSPALLVWTRLLAATTRR